MSKYDFMKKVEGILTEFDETTGCTVESNTYIRNNDVKRYGVCIRRDGESIAPTFYLDKYYEDFKRKKLTAEEAAEDIIIQLKQLSELDMENISVDMSFESCRDMITYRLVSLERNKNLLSTVPYVPFLDLAIIFAIVFSNSETGIESVRITNECIDRWGVTTEELMKLAVVNTPKLFPTKLETLANVLSDYFGVELDQDEPLSPALYLLSNKSGVYGASALLYDQTMESIAEKLGRSFYVLPSSIHELLILPESGDEDTGILNSIITQINTEHVKKEEILSDRAYFYDISEKRFDF